MKHRHQSTRHWVQKVGNKYTNWIKKIIDINTDHCNKELEILKFNWSKRNNFWDKLFNLEAMNSWLNDTEKWVSDLEDRIMEMTQ